MSKVADSPADYKAPKNLLRDKVILVTGAGSGIGRQAALSFAEYGAEVILSGRNQQKLESCYDEIVASGHKEPALYTVDLHCAEEQPYLELAGTIEQTFGRLDGLLHNASLLGERKAIENQSVSSWLEVQQVNLNGGFLLTKSLLPLLRQTENASVVFTSSSVGRKGRAYWGAYAVSKFATEGLMQVLADELENTSTIRVNSINPGATNTEMRKTAYPAEAPDSNPDPIEIMPAYLYLMGKDSIGVTGQALNAQ